MKTYTIEVGFNGFIGCTETYTVEANDENEAIELAREEDNDDLSFEVLEVEDDE